MILTQFSLIQEDLFYNKLTPFIKYKEIMCIEWYSFSENQLISLLMELMKNITIYFAKKMVTVEVPNNIQHTITF